MTWDIQSFVIKCILQGGDWFDWVLDMLEINTISACLPYEADPYIPVICHSLLGQHFQLHLQFAWHVYLKPRIIDLFLFLPH
jgi:hypothetical protein